MGFGHWLAGISESGQVKLYCVTHPSFDFGFGRPRGNAARKIRRVGR
jgi:hypothetical protein